MIIDDAEDLVNNTSVEIKLLENNPKYLAQASIDLGTLGVEVRNFLIGQKDGKIWVMPPFWGNVKGGLKSKSYYFYMWDVTVWKLLSEKIIDEYKKVSGQ